MPLRIHRDQPATRISGTLLGIAFVAMGAFSIIGADEYATGVSHERAMGFGATAVIIGIIIGTYSSIFLAAPLLAVWKEREEHWQRMRRRVMRKGGQDEYAARGVITTENK